MFGRSMFRRGQDFSRNFCRKLHFFKVSRSFECLIFPGLTTIRLKSSVVTIPMMSNHLFFLLVHLVLPIFCSINKNWFLKNFEKNPKTGQCLAGQCFADYCTLICRYCSPTFVCSRHAHIPFCSPKQRQKPSDGRNAEGAF